MISGTPERAIIDTSVYVENVRYGRFEAELLKLPFLVRVEHLARNFSAVAPSARDWVRSGRIVRMLADRHNFEVHKIGKLHFDVLIALALSPCPPLRRRSQGLTVNLPYSLKFRSKAKALLALSRSISAKLVQSVKLNGLSS